MDSKQEKLLRARAAELEKQLVEKSRDLEIEASLERVRTMAMGMRTPDDLLSICQILFEELTALGFVELRNAMINIVNDEKGSFLNYDFNGSSSSVTPFLYNSHPIMVRQVAITRSASDAFIEHILTGDELEDFKAFRVKNGELPDPKLENVSAVYYYFYSIGVGSVGISAFSALTEEKRDVLKRFRNVFDLAYRRYTDIQLAETQAREAQIELALERVRARTMAMQHSEELAETAFILFQQFKELGENPDQATIGIINEEEHVIDYWVTMYGSQINKVFKFPIDEHNVTHKIYKAWKANKKSLVIDLSGKELYDFAKFRESMGGAAFNPDEKRRVINVAFFSKGLINVQSSEERSQESIRLLERFAGVFEGTYTRFLDLKKAEAQAKEAQIELALERVRARTMAMQKSEELKEIIKVVYEQLVNLNILAEHAGFIMDYQVNDYMDIWLADKHFDPSRVTVPYFDTPHWNSFNDAKKKGRDFFTNHFTFEEKNKFYRDLFALVPGVTDESREYYFTCSGLAISTVLLDNVGLYIENFSGTPYTDEENNTLMRFGKVFQQTYTRFLDLKKAEAQAREAQVELSLERVRAKTMAMHTSEDVGETVATMFDELVKLGVEKTVRCGISVIDEAQEMEVWRASYDPDGKVDMVIGRIDMTIHPLLKGVYKAWKNKETAYAYDLAGEDIKEYYRAINNSPKYPAQFEIGSLESKQFHNAFFFPEGAIFVFSLEQLSEDAVKLFKRFAGVFGLTYRRFLDLQKAEEQAREAHIEAALERVRAAAMAMHDSNDVGNATALVFSELYKLGITTIRCGVVIIEESTQLMEVWSATSPKEGKIDQGSGKLDMTTHPLWQNLFNTWKQKKPVLTYELAGQDLWDYYKAISSAPGYHAPELDPDYAIPDDISKARQYCNCFIFAEGGLFAFTLEPFSPKESQILEKFTAVFSLTYRRYLDLKQAEEQAREATIEASLERVRGKAMAMRNTNDLSVTASTVFTELRNLGINPIRSGVGLVTKETRKAKIYSSTSSSTAADLSLMGEVTLSGHPAFEQQYRSWLKQENYAVALKGAELASYNKILSAGLNADLDITGKDQAEQYGHWFMFSEGFLYAWSAKSYTEAEMKILERFKNVIELTFRRYIELQKSEISARDAVREASLDRVRAEIASMRSTEDLERITPLIWNELTILGIPFIRCGVFIVDEQAQVFHTHLSTADGKALATFNLPFDSEGIGRDVLPAWRKKQAAAIHWSREEFANYTKNLVEQGTVKSKERYVTEHPDTSLDLHFFPFLQGMLYVGNVAPLMDDEKDLVQSLADAFSTAYARYEDFNKLEAAKEQVENTLTDLKAAQTKLIQSEKMASLGELTAGIAHEIQNPLNFVNNFSEVNQEMIDELQEELRAGNIEEALALAADIKQNEEKINHHGKRADGIVKGMLQHSRTGGGEKQPTNMNTLADEFLRLSYHGLRAKDKLFNSEMVTHFDPDLPKTNVIAQDMGRVLLNLFNNAFYAVNQKHKTTGDEYKPEVSVTTFREDGQVIIKVKDNGAGIPDAIKEKIMQPFFTTKPTGEGTGLGLSLTYDMVVKGHGGSIQVNSVEGEGSEFIIQLPIT